MTPQRVDSTPTVEHALRLMKSAEALIEHSTKTGTKSGEAQISLQLASCYSAAAANRLALASFINSAEPVGW